MPLVFDVLAAGVAVAAYGTFFSMPARMLPLPILVGMVAHGARWAAIAVVGVSVEVAALLACLIVGGVVTPLADRMRLPFAAVAFASVVALIPGVYVFRMAEGFLRLAVAGAATPPEVHCWHAGGRRLGIPDHALPWRSGSFFPRSASSASPGTDWTRSRGSRVHGADDETEAREKIPLSSQDRPPGSTAEASHHALGADSFADRGVTVTTAGGGRAGLSEDLHYTFSQSLIFLARRWRNLMNHELSSVGQSQARWGTLYWIDVFGDSLNQTELADRIGVEQQTLGRVLRDLQSEGPHRAGAESARSAGEGDPSHQCRRSGDAPDRAHPGGRCARNCSGISRPEQLGVCMSVFAAILANMDTPAAKD